MEGVGCADQGRALIPCPELLVSHCWDTAVTTLLLCIAQSFCAVPSRAQRQVREQFPYNGKRSCPPLPSDSGPSRWNEAHGVLQTCLPMLAGCWRSPHAGEASRLPGHPGMEISPVYCVCSPGLQRVSRSPGRLHPSPA